MQFVRVGKKKGLFTKRKIPKCKARPNTFYFLLFPWEEGVLLHLLSSFDPLMTSLRLYLHKQKRFPPSLNLFFPIFHIFSMFYSAKAFFTVSSFACPSTPTFSMINLSSLAIMMLDVGVWVSLVLTEFTEDLIYNIHVFVKPIRLGVITHRDIK